MQDFINFTGAGMDDQENILDTLPTVDHAPCNDCGASNWSSCNIDEKNGGFCECDKCHYWDEKEQKLKRRLNA